MDYKKWAEDHGDVFTVEAEITLHVDEGNPEPEWETIPRKRYVFLLSVLLSLKVGLSCVLKLKRGSFYLNKCCRRLCVTKNGNLL